MELPVFGEVSNLGHLIRAQRDFSATIIQANIGGSGRGTRSFWTGEDEDSRLIGSEMERDTGRSDWGRCSCIGTPCFTVKIAGHQGDDRVDLIIACVGYEVDVGVGQLAANEADFLDRLARTRTFS